jgi:CheY-like chemotaxis protein
MDKKIALAIDDVASELSLISVALEPRFDVRLVKSAGSALNFLARQEVDIILLDIEMPGMSGFEFLHEIKKNPKLIRVPIVVVSSHSEEEALELAMKEGASGYIAKPINAGTLLQKIDEALAHAPQQLFPFLA